VATWWITKETYSCALLKRCCINVVGVSLGNDRSASHTFRKTVGRARFAGVSKLKFARSSLKTSPARKEPWLVGFVYEKLGNPHKTKRGAWCMTAQTLIHYAGSENNCDFNPDFRGWASAKFMRKSGRKCRIVETH